MKATVRTLDNREVGDIELAEEVFGLPVRRDILARVVNWQLEGYPPTALHRLGWRRDVTMKVGDTITVSAWRARDGGHWAHSREITLPSGEKMMFGPPAGTGDGGSQPAVDVP